MSFGVVSPSWKIDAASTASAPASKASRICSAVSAPPEAITGTRTARATAPVSSKIVARAGAVAVPGGRQHLAGPARSASRAHSCVDAGALAPALDQHLRPAVAPGGIDC